MATKEIGSLIRQLENDYQNAGETTLSKYVQFDLRENLDKIDAYANSKHISGPVDSMGRDKPFFNIGTSAVNVVYRATDIDRRNILIKPTKLKDTTRAFIATMKVQEWMRKSYFGTFLNKWGRTLAKYGSAVTKFVEKDGELHAVVVNWHKVIIDPIDFYSNPVIEILEYTPAQLRKNKSYDQGMVASLISAVQSRETADGQNKDNRAGYIRLYEIHGELSKSLLTEKEADEDIYVQQMQVVSFVMGEKENDFDDFVLVKGKEESPYLLHSLIEEDNRSTGIGAIEYLFESQWMENHSMKAIKDQLDLASKLIFQTADDTYVGQNALLAIEQGDILVHRENMPLTQINNGSHDITQFQNFGTSWKQLGNEIVGISEAMLGQTPKSGTAWRQTEAVLAESHDLFELMTENKGLGIEEMFRKYVLKFVRKQLSNRKEIMGVLTDSQIKQIDVSYINSETEKRIKKEVIDSLVKGELPVSMDVQSTQESIQEELSKMGNTRSFIPSEDVTEKQWKEYFEDMEWDLEVDVTGEQTNTGTYLTTLTTVLQTIATNPLVLSDPNAKMIFSKILTMTGAVSPLELTGTQTPPPQTPEVTQPQVSA